MTLTKDEVISLAREFACARPAAAEFLASLDQVKPRYTPRLAGRNVRNADDPADGYVTREEARAAAVRYREDCRKWLLGQKP